MEADLKQINYAYMSTAPARAEMTAQPTPAPAPAAVMVLNANAAPPLGHEPQRMTCPSCQNVMQTRLAPRANKNTHLLALILCLTGLVCLVPLPYCLKSCRSLDHYCSCCNQYLGKAVN
ncbi:lipopolysaccharide-induced tumor necrosis factor-alpha factor homolog [Drosophila virilis]|uniref:LITAF domain-containing protein n=1 Tax=Drosophila virilis TaxID=7244 RepID=A0A0Q9W4K1_DROVI|nr:lipopolysaccharide-induced tumor necrosis factor-alpha factor homolog [Drosophila virilis]KRF79980.1 uncharacterized protein Dvir_GJ25660 [Drosophila virilis]